MKQPSMRPTSSLRAFLHLSALALIFALAAGACGSDSIETSTTAVAETSETAPETDDTQAAPAEDTSSSRLRVTAPTSNCSSTAPWHKTS